MIRLSFATVTLPVWYMAQTRSCTLELLKQVHPGYEEAWSMCFSHETQPYQVRRSRRDRTAWDSTVRAPKGTLQIHRSIVWLPEQR